MDCIWVEQDFPDYHRKPLKLTNKEIQNPELVLRSFFESYSLVNVRAAVQHVLYSSIEAIPSDKPIFVLNFLSDVEKVIEACCLIAGADKPVEGTDENI